MLIMGAVLGLWGCGGRTGSGTETRQEMTLPTEAEAGQEAAVLRGTEAGQKTAAPRGEEHVEEEEEMDDLTFMVTAYGFREEELLEIDLKRLIEDYGLRREAYTADEVREILELEADVYQDRSTEMTLS